MNGHLHRSAAVAVTALAIVGCTSDTSSVGSTSVAPATTAPAPITAAPTTAAPVTTSETATTSADHPLKYYVLRTGGLGEFDFSISPAAMIDELTSYFGPAEQQDTEYPIENALDSGRYGTDEEPATLYDFPFGRTLCWPFRFCVQLGGSDRDSITAFTGWTYTDDRTQPPIWRRWHLSAADGLTVGMSILQDPAYATKFLYREVECQDIAVGGVSGFKLELISLNGPFPDFSVVGYSGGVVDERGTVVINRMNSGTLPKYTGSDRCGL